MEALARIEVVRGPASVMYGSDAIGGIVNLIPNTLPEYSRSLRVSPQVAIRYSSADEGYSASVKLNGNYKSFSSAYAVTVKKIGHLRAGGDIGKQIPTGWEEVNHSLRIGLILNSKNSLIIDHLAARHNEVPRYDKYVSGDFEKYVYDPQNRDLISLTLKSKNPTSTFQDLKTNISYQREVEGRIQKKTDMIHYTVAEDKITTWGGCIQASFVPQAGHHIICGLEHYRDRIRSEQDRIENDVIESIRPSYPDGSKYLSVGLFLQDKWHIGKNIILATGIRYSSYGIDSPLEDPFGRYEDTFGDITELLALSYYPFSQLNLIARWSNGFRAPNLNDAVVLKTSSSGVDAPSPYLKSENSSNFEVGMKFKHAVIEGSLFGFYNKLDNLIDRCHGIYNGLTFLDENGNGIKDIDEFDIYQKCNIARARIYGIEYGSILKFNQQWFIRTNLFWTFGVNITDNEPLSRIPPLMGMVAIRHHLGKTAWFELYARIAGAQRRLSARDIDDSRIDPAGTDSWATLNFRTGFHLNKIDINVNLTNIADYAYKEHGSGVYSPGRNLAISVTYTP
jgi:outer membrane receptor protein involved in Fe transport